MIRIIKKLILMWEVAYDRCPKCKELYLDNGICKNCGYSIK